MEIYLVPLSDGSKVMLALEADTYLPLPHVEYAFRTGLPQYEGRSRISQEAKKEALVAIGSGMATPKSTVNSVSTVDFRTSEYFKLGPFTD